VFTLDVGQGDQILQLKIDNLRHTL